MLTPEQIAVQHIDDTKRRLAVLHMLQEANYRPERAIRIIRATEHLKELTA